MIFYADRRNDLWKKSMLFMSERIPMRTVSESIYMIWMQKAGEMKERKVVPINNPSDLLVSKDGRFLYSIADEGVEAFHILPDGGP